VFFYKSFCLHLGCLSTIACPAHLHVCLQELLCAPGVSVYKRLCFTYACTSTKAFVCNWGVCLQESVLHLCMSVYKSFCVHLGCLSTRDCVALIHVCLQELLSIPGVSVYKSLCCTYAWLFTRAFVCTWSVCLLVHFLIEELCASSESVCLQEPRLHQFALALHLEGVCIYKSLYCTFTLPVFFVLHMYIMCLPTRAIVLRLHGSVYDSFCAAPGCTNLNFPPQNVEIMIKNLILYYGPKV
jgi:hypothetical protein